MLVNEQALRAACHVVSTSWPLSGDQIYRLYKEVESNLAPSPRAQALEEAEAALNKIVNNWGNLHHKDLMQARSAIRALSSQPVADGWLPIETAPKDGTAVLVHFLPNEVPSLNPLICAAYWQRSDGLMKPGFWRVFHSVGPSFTPTHWRPLPASPGASE